MAYWQKMREALKSVDSSPALKKMLHVSYDFPIGMGLIRRWKWTSKIPVCPTYGLNRTSEDEHEGFLPNHPQSNGVHGEDSSGRNHHDSGDASHIGNGDMTSV